MRRWPLVPTLLICLVVVFGAAACGESAAEKASENAERIISRSFHVDDVDCSPMEARTGGYVSDCAYHGGHIYLTCPKADSSACMFGGSSPLVTTQAPRRDAAPGDG